jgi:NADPH2:quinone reductase
MRAAFYECRGPAREVLTLGEHPTPEPGPGEVRVRVAVSAVNPSDTKGRGTWRGAAAMAYPRVIPHQDGAGTIDRVGAGVDVARVGERVWLHMAQRDGSAFGTAAEFVVVPAHKAAPLPDNASFDEGASLGIPAMTAHYALFADGPIVGKVVLVQGGAGAVGFYAVQMAKWAGAAHVFATVSREDQAAQAQLAGADTVINRKTEDVAERVRAVIGREHPVDRIIEVDFGANQDLSLALLADNGVIAAYASDAVQAPSLRYFDFAARNATIRTVLIYAAPQQARDAAARDITRMLETGRLQHQTALRLPFERIVEAHEAMESGRVVGKILLTVTA